jgi:hypothetical protein
VFGLNLRGSSHIPPAAPSRTALGIQIQSAIAAVAPSSLKDWYKPLRPQRDVAIYGTQKWEVFAMYEVKANEPISTLRNNWNPLAGASTATVQKWIDGQISRSEIKFGVSVKPTDQLMTLITCGNNYDYSTANSRLFGS